jgi:maltose alpha-D-glucosyltransferase/alpha-amylase
MAGPKWLENAVFYEIYPQSFYDSNGDGIGDLPGIIAKLDYISSLGVNAIWLNPCFESPFQDAGYDVSDFYKVAARYGTNADLKRLFNLAHKRGMKVILDLVAGHTSIEHPWFKESCNEKKNKYSNYYIWTDAWLNGAEGYRFINGYVERDGNCMINFFYCQPALNYGFKNPDPKCPWQLPMNHPDVKAMREELRKIMKFWLDMGCDGFRVDMASSLVRGSDAAAGIKELWHDYRSWLDKNYPEAILVSEWSNPALAVNAGFHVDFLVHFGLPGYTTMFRKEKYRVPNSPYTGGNSFFDREGKGDASLFAEEIIEQLRLTAGKGYLSVPTGNHDIGRLRQGRSMEELKVAYACIFTLPGVPFLYYGDEIGMDYVYNLVSKEGGYNRTGARTPMQWEKGTKAGFSTVSPKDFYLPIDPKADRPTVAEQEKDQASLLNFIRKLIKLRRDNPALASDGEFKPVFSKRNTYPFVYKRMLGSKRFVIAVNPSGKKAVAEFGLPAADKAKAVLDSGCNLELRHGTVRLTMPPASYAIYGI